MLYIKGDVSEYDLDGLTVYEKDTTTTEEDTDNTGSTEDTDDTINGTNKKMGDAGMKSAIELLILCAGAVLIIVSSRRRKKA